MAWRRNTSRANIMGISHPSPRSGMRVGSPAKYVQIELCNQTHTIGNTTRDCANSQIQGISGISARIDGRTPNPLDIGKKFVRDGCLWKLTDIYETASPYHTVENLTTVPNVSCAPFPYTPPHHFREMVVVGCPNPNNQPIQAPHTVVGSIDGQAPTQNDVGRVLLIGMDRVKVVSVNTLTMPASPPYTIGYSSTNLPCTVTPPTSAPPRARVSRGRNRYLRGRYGKGRGLSQSNMRARYGGGFRG